MHISPYMQNISLYHGMSFGQSNQSQVMDIVDDGDDVSSYQDEPHYGK